MRIHAFEYDLARSQRAHPQHLRKLVDGLAEFGFNLMTINLEHRFEFPSGPGIAPPGSLTTAMAQDLVAYGRSRGVEVVAQPNLIGHCEGIGATERYAHLSADGFQQGPWGGYEQLNLELSESRELVRALFADVCRAFPGPYIHIGGDEVRRMDYLFPTQPERRVPAMLEQFHFILSLARAAGRQVMMWGDMPLHYPELMAALPRDVIICDWHYGPDGSRETLARYKAEGFRVLAAPAVHTHSAFCSQPDVSDANISKMVGDARDLGLEGFLLTQWEAGFGSGFDLVWPWIAFAGAVAKGEQPGAPEGFLSGFGAARYGVAGADFARLHLLLSRDLKAAIELSGACPPRALVTLRKALFRAADPFPSLARPAGIPGNTHQEVWAPSPFHVWLYLRPILTADMLDRFTALAQEAGALVERMRSAATRHTDELIALLAIGRAFVIMVERFRTLEAAKAEYHRAALAQPGDPRAFRQALDRTAEHLDRLRPGIIELKRWVQEMNSASGLSADELRWLEVHEESLDAHLDALRSRRPEQDSLLEFGEFLRRPANIAPRLTWR